MIRTWVLAPALVAAALAAPAAAQEVAAPRASPPVKMAVEGEVAPFRPRGGTATPATKLAVKNTTRETLTCRLAATGARARVVTFAPGQEFAERFAPTTDLALTCPQVRRAAYAPLLLGSRYVFVRLEGGAQLVEVAPPNPP